MLRRQIDPLEAWLARPTRRPLVLRGARQVGKTWLVRELAKQAGRDLIELNLERDPALRSAFATNHPASIVGELSLLFNRPIEPASSLLFIDEIQAAGELLAKLRWFYEEMPALPVVAAGSLLEFALAEHAWSMPVGRITFQNLEPMGFPEFLRAHDQERLLASLSAWRPGRVLSELTHRLARRWFDRYAMIGGMPAVVAADIAGEPPQRCRVLQRDLTATYRADFAKYSGRMDRDILDHVLRAVAGSLGHKFVYARAADAIKAHQAKRGLELLARAQICHILPHCAANGLPLGAETSDRLRKAILADVGLLHALVGTPAAQAHPSWTALSANLRGQIIEQLAGQTLRLVVSDGSQPPELFYWQREGGRAGEIDYLIQLHGHILPIEIKSGAAGAMKSLHQFMHDKQLPMAVRCDNNPPSLQPIDVKTTQGQAVSYQLLNLPHYLLWNLAEIFDQLVSEGG